MNIMYLILLHCTKSLNLSFKMHKLRNSHFQVIPTQLNPIKGNTNKKKARKPKETTVRVLASTFIS